MVPVFAIFLTCILSLYQAKRALGLAVVLLDLLCDLYTHVLSYVLEPYCQGNCRHWYIPSRLAGQRPSVVVLSLGNSLYR